MRGSALLFYPITYCVAGGIFAFLFHPVRADWLGALLLASMIVLYGFMAKNNAIKEDGETAEIKFREIGDNCYFIGFIFTLVVIVATLILDADALLADPKPLLKTIGIALATSVAGMLMRFILSQDLIIPEDKFHEEVIKVAAAANIISSEATKVSDSMQTSSQILLDTSQKMQHFYISLGEKIENIDDTLSKLISGLGNKINDTLQENLFSDVKSQLTEIVASHKAAVERARQDLSVSMESLNQTKTTTINTADEIRQAISALTQTLNSLNESLSDYTEKQKAAIGNTVLEIEKNEKLLQLASEAKEKYKNLSSKAVAELYSALIEGANAEIKELEKNKSQTKGKQRK